jgi:hypothetical protein
VVDGLEAVPPARTAAAPRARARCPPGLPSTMPTYFELGTRGAGSALGDEAAEQRLDRAHGGTRWIRRPQRPKPGWPAHCEAGGVRAGPVEALPHDVGVDLAHAEADSSTAMGLPAELRRELWARRWCTNCARSGRSKADRRSAHERRGLPKSQLPSRARRWARPVSDQGLSISSGIDPSTPRLRGEGEPPGTVGGGAPLPPIARKAAVPAYAPGGLAARCRGPPARPQPRRPRYSHVARSPVRRGSGISKREGPGRGAQEDLRGLRRRVGP